MKKLLLAGFLIAFQSLQSQDLIQHIPQNSSIILEVNVPKILEALPLTEFENSDIGKELLKTLSEVFESRITSLTDIGINTNFSQYIFMVDKGNNIEFVYLLPLTNANLIQQKMEQNQNKIINESGYNKVYHYDPITTINWNESLLSIVINMKIDEYGGLPDTGNSSSNYLSKISSTITNNTSFNKHKTKSKETAVNFWMGNLSDNISSLIKFDKKTGSLIATPNLIKNLYNDYKSFSLNLYIEEKETRITTAMEFSPEYSKTLKKTFKHRFNKDLFNYVNIDNSLAYFSNNIDTEEALKQNLRYLDEKVIPNTAESSYKEEMSLGITLISTLLDEEAIGEIIKGDFLFVLSGISEREVEYTTYTYDSSFNRLPVVKTKMEKVPDFIAMASTGENKLLPKTISYLESKNFIENQSGYYKINAGTEVPFDYYFMIKNDIIFLGTSRSQFQNIVNGSYVPRVSSKSKKEILKGHTTFYIGIGKAQNYISKEDFSNEKEYNKILDLIMNTPDIFFSAKKIRRNTATSSLLFMTPEGYKNGLEYIMSFIDKLSK